MQTYHVTIERLDAQGFGIYTHPLPNNETREVLIPYTYPGDKVEIAIIKKKRKKWQGSVINFIEYSKERTLPKCPHFGVCGGCFMQQIPYSEQLEIKTRQIKKLFPETLPILKADSVWNYRNKMEFSFSMDKKGNRYLGLYNTRGKVENLNVCPISPDWFSAALNSVRAWWETTSLSAFHPRSGTGSLRTLTLRDATFGKMAFLTVSGDPNYAINKEDIEGFKQALAFLNPISLYIRIQQAIKGQPTQFFEMPIGGADTIEEVLRVPDPLKFSISPASFFQPNPRQAEKLYQYACDMISCPPPEVIYDLYCGTGTLGIILAKRGYKVYGIELSPESSLDARENAKANNVQNIEIITGDVGEILAKKEYPLPKVVVVDPPRTGLNDKALEQIVGLKPQEILYISCNPETQARDVELFKSYGFRFIKGLPVDQFPQTPHIENIVLLSCAEPF